MDSKKSCKGEYSLEDMINEHKFLIHNNNGFAKFEMGDYVGAIADFDEALKIMPGYEAYNNRGAAKLQMSDYVGAIADSDEALKIKPGYEAYNNKSSAKLQMGDYAGAIADSDEVLKIMPGYEAYINRSSAKLQMGDYAGAIADLDEALKIKPKYDDYYNRGSAKLKLGDYAGAIADLDEALKIMPRYEAYINRGAAKLELNDYAGAIADFDKSISLNLNNATAYYMRGVAKEMFSLNKPGRDYMAAAKLLIEQAGHQNKPVLESILLSSTESSKIGSRYLLSHKKESLSFLGKLSKLEKKVIKNLTKDGKVRLANCFQFGDRCELLVSRINGREELMPHYRLSKVRGRKVFGAVEPMLRDDEGDILAIPKRDENGGRTCWLPELGIELKGIGTILGRPKGNYGKRSDTEEPDPVGGMLKDKAIYEHLANVYLYISGVDVPEPLGVAIPYKIRGPKKQMLAVLARRPKTPFRGSDLLEVPDEVMKKVASNLRKMHWLGLVHYWYHDDNFNAEGQLLDLEGVRIANEHMPKLQEEEQIAYELLNNLINALPKSIMLEQLGPLAKEESWQVISNCNYVYDTCSEIGVRLMPPELTDSFAGLFTDYNKPSRESVMSMRDPRDLIGKYAKKLLASPLNYVRERAQHLYSKYRQDVAETMKIASRFRKEIEYVAKRHR